MATPSFDLLGPTSLESSWTPLSLLQAASKLSVNANGSTSNVYHLHCFHPVSISYYSPMHHTHPTVVPWAYQEPSQLRTFEFLVLSSWRALSPGNHSLTLLLHLLSETFSTFLFTIVVPTSPPPNTLPSLVHIPHHQFTSYISLLLIYLVDTSLH